MIGNVFSIEEFSVYDGPGIRTTVFLKGCPLKCSWCHNPEGQRKQCEIVRSPNGCIMCGKCEQYARVLEGRRVFTEESIKKCPMNLLRICGEKMASDELCERLFKNERILRNGGGVTFSGGEPFVQSEFMIECLKKLKGRLHTAIQTSGYCIFEKFCQGTQIADYILFDIKLMDNRLHQIYTGVSNKCILDNFDFLARGSTEFVVRTPLVPGVTDTRENLEEIAKLLRHYGINYIELLPYNKMAGGKYKMLMRKYEPDFDESQEVNTHREIFDKFNINIKVM